MSHRAIPASRTKLRAALLLSAVGAVLAGGAGAAGADELPGVRGAAGGALQGLSSSVDPVEHLKLYPMAGSTVDPLTNGVETQVADFKPIGTTTVTRPLTDGASLSQLPVVGQFTGLLHR